jgi:hypothetical protein
MPTPNALAGFETTSVDLFGVIAATTIDQPIYSPGKPRTATKHYVESPQQAVRRPPKHHRAEPTEDLRGSWPEPHPFKFASFGEELVVDDSDFFEEEKCEELEPLSSDTFEVILAKLMFNRFKHDIGFGFEKPKVDSPQFDLFSDMVSISEGNQVRLLDKINAIIWLFELHPQEVRVSVNWVFLILDLDLDLIRRIVARNTRADIRTTIELLAPLGTQYAKECIEKVTDFVDLSDLKI